MSRFFSLMKKELFYGGLSREEFLQIREPIARNNQRALIVWSATVGMFWILSLLLSLRSPDYAACRPVYIPALFVCVLTLLCALFGVERRKELLFPAMYLFELSSLAAGIGIAILQPSVRTATMIALVIIVPSSFIDRTAVSVLLLLINIAGYILMGKNVIVPPVYSWGLLNLCIFSLAGILTGHVINKSRCERYVFEDSARKLAEVEANYNAELQKDVAAKTEKIQALQDTLVVGMATLVESRDNTTGGHIRRTRACVRMLVEAILADGALGLTEEFGEKIINAAPMHDLGKIVVDDEILRKPGNYSPGEYDRMKAHAAEGARIIHNILKDIEDDEFRRVAENVAHYHHEHMDGTGYPDGLKGEEIPLEARIMAVADVYDALVSKRPYKDGLSFEEVNQLMLEGMGPQFDPRLKKYYEAARPKLEAYYAEALSEANA